MDTTHALRQYVSPEPDWDHRNFSSRAFAVISFDKAAARVHAAGRVHHHSYLTCSLFPGSISSLLIVRSNIATMDQPGNARNPRRCFSW